MEKWIVREKLPVKRYSIESYFIFRTNKKWLKVNINVLRKHYILVLYAKCVNKSKSEFKEMNNLPKYKRVLNFN